MTVKGKLDPETKTIHVSRSRWHQRADCSREHRIQAIEENGQRPLALPVLLCPPKRLLPRSRPYLPVRTIACLEQTP